MLSSASDRADRLAAATGALLLQAGFIAAFFYAFSFQAPPPRPLEREEIFFLPPLPRIVPAKPPEAVPPHAREAPPATATPPLFVPPPTSVRPSPEAPPAQALQNFGQALQDCTPGNYENLPPERKARCTRPGEGVAVQQLPNPMGSPSHVKDEAHWEEVWAREQSPAMLPCLGFVDVICLLKKVAEGSLDDYGDPRTWPHYEVEQLPKGDFYKIEQAYDAWHKAHPLPQASTESVSVHPQ
jgi:hypothetical protein